MLTCTFLSHMAHAYVHVPVPHGSCSLPTMVVALSADTWHAEAAAARMHTRMHTHMHAWMHGWTHTCMHAYMHACIHADTERAEAAAARIAALQAEGGQEYFGSREKDDIMRAMEEMQLAVGVPCMHAWTGVDMHGPEWTWI